MAYFLPSWIAKGKENSTWKSKSNILLSSSINLNLFTSTSKTLHSEYKRAKIQVFNLKFSGRPATLNSNCYATIQGLLNWNCVGVSGTLPPVYLPPSGHWDPHHYSEDHQEVGIKVKIMGSGIEFFTDKLFV